VRSWYAEFAVVMTAGAGRNVDRTEAVQLILSSQVRILAARLRWMVDSRLIHLFMGTNIDQKNLRFPDELEYDSNVGSTTECPQAFKGSG